MEFLYVKGTNFLSFKNLYYKISNGQPVLIKGENRTDDGQDSNGSGKTALSSAIEYCWLHTTSRNFPDKKLVFWGENESKLESEIVCPIRNEVLKIERIISISDGGKAQLSLNGVIKYKFDDNMSAEIDKFIFAWIGITKEDIQNYYIINKFKYTSFFSASNTKLNQLIGRFSNSSIIEGIDKDIIDKVIPIEKEKADLFSQKNHLYGMMDVYKNNLANELIVDTQKLFEDKLSEIDDKIIKNEENILNYDKQNTELTTEINENNELLIGTLENINSTNKILEGLKKSFDNDYLEVDNKIKSIKDSKLEIEEQRADFSNSKKETLNILNEAEINLLGAIICPNCKFEFIPGKENIDISQEKDIISGSSEIIKSIDNSLELLTSNLDEFDKQIKSAKNERLLIESEENMLNIHKQKLNNQIQTLTQSKMNIENKIKSYEYNIRSNNETISLLVKTNSELVKSKSQLDVSKFDNTEKIDSIKDSISDCEAQLKVIEEKDKELDDKIFELKKWSLIFKQFIQNLSVGTLGVLQNYANKFLNDMGSDMRVELSGYKIKADNTLSDKITTYVIRYGLTNIFESFSGGERVRLECAIILTIQYAINSAHKYGGLNFLSVDEVFESADASGISNLTSSLKGLGKTIQIITQMPINSPNCDVLEIIKENGISYLNIKNYD